MRPWCFPTQDASAATSLRLRQISTAHAIIVWNPAGRIANVLEGDLDYLMGQMPNEVRQTLNETALRFRPGKNLIHKGRVVPV